MAGNKNPNANRHHGGPGSSHQRADLPDPTENPKISPSDRDRHPHSQVSGGGGERDSHHTHDPDMKGET
jgi:hypothetical protein